MLRCLVFLLILSACAETLPDTSRTISARAQAAPYPTLQPVDALLSEAQDGSRIDAATAQLQVRAARLRQKAAALRGRTIVDGQDRIRRINGG